jgi:hypothetical protein
MARAMSSTRRVEPPSTCHWATTAASARSGAPAGLPDRRAGSCPGAAWGAGARPCRPGVGSRGRGRRCGGPRDAGAHARHGQHRPSGSPRRPSAPGPAPCHPTSRRRRLQPSRNSSKGAMLVMTTVLLLACSLEPFTSRMTRWSFRPPRRHATARPRRVSNRWLLPTLWPGSYTTSRDSMLVWGGVGGGRASSREPNRCGGRRGRHAGPAVQVRLYGELVGAQCGHFVDGERLPRVADSHDGSVAPQGLSTPRR